MCIRDSPRTDLKFGICDDEDGSPAYTTDSNEDTWGVRIINDNQITTVFTAIDNCIIINKPNSQDQESTCDGMLTFNESLFLVELKNQGTGGWISTAISQLKNTIRLLEIDGHLNNLRYKKAYACNRKHPRFKVIDHERKIRFFREHGFSCLLYTSPSPRDATLSRMPSSA